MVPPDPAQNPERNFIWSAPGFAPFIFRKLWLARSFLEYQVKFVHALLFYFHLGHPTSYLLFTDFITDSGSSPTLLLFLLTA